MGGSITGTPTNIQYLDNVSVQFVYTGTPTGVLAIQGSLDYSQGTGGTVLAAGNWTTIPLSPAITQPAGAGGVCLVDLNQLSFPWIRLIYTRTSGTGALDAFVSGKAV